MSLGFLPGFLKKIKKIKPFKFAFVHCKNLKTAVWCTILYMACFRCGRTSHFANNCFAKTTIRGKIIESDSSDESEIEEYYRQPKRKQKYTSSTGKRKNTSSAKGFNTTTTNLQCHTNSRAGVYVLKTTTGLYYVGKSNDIDARILDHRRGIGAACLEGKGGFEVIFSLLTSGSTSDLESWERNETLQRMLTHGIDNVRGWMFTATMLSEDDRRDAFRQICEKYDLCRRCGRNTHFSDQCFAGSGAYWTDGIALK
jgi:predicted GIY-YIG superfamily endonuclease